MMKKVYVKGRDNLIKLLQSKVMLQEDEEALYIYRIEINKRTHTGIFGCVSVDDYNKGRIVKHELTRFDKEDYCTKHIIALSAHPEPVMLTFRDSENIAQSFDSVIQSNDPIYDLTTEDNVTHTIWKVVEISFLVEAFGAIKNLYIADGHHRCASAARVAKEFAFQNPKHTGNESYNFFPAVIFPTEQLQILPYNRVVLSIPDNFMELLMEDFVIQKKSDATPPKKGDVSLYLNGNWYGIQFEGMVENDLASALDISLLQDQILEPLLGIDNQVPIKY